MTYNFDRFLRYDEMVSWLHDLQKQFPGLVALETYGKSHKGRDLWIATVTDTTTGAHNTKPAHWIDANIHATEATGSVAALFILEYLANNFGKHDQVTEALRTRTFYIVPRVNPDGAELYTRENANKVDLNRDSIDLSQPESQLLRKVFDEFKPDFCFNLHDQRTIFGAGTSGLPATVSFLAPSYNEQRDVNAVRAKAMQVIVGMNKELQKYIPGQVALFDDSFNPNCIGDQFTLQGVPTILFEAGHFQNDYYREFTRKMIFIALISGLLKINEIDIVDGNNADYFEITKNNIVFYDFLYKNVKINYDSKEIITNFAAQYKEELIDGKLQLNAYIVEIGELKGKFGHYQYNAHKMHYEDNSGNCPKLDQKANFTLGKVIRFENGIKL